MLLLCVHIGGFEKLTADSCSTYLGSSFVCEFCGTANMVLHWGVGDLAPVQASQGKRTRWTGGSAEEWWSN